MVPNENNRKAKRSIAKSILFFLMIWLMVFISDAAIAQDGPAYPIRQKKDSVYRYFPKHSPVKATWMSAALPGLGQYYNEKYWKIPIIYAGFSTLAYFVIQNRYEYDRFKEAYAIKAELSDGQVSGNYLVDNYTSSQLLNQREYYQSNLELSYILTGVFYLLQIVDATVDAHLYEFDMSDDLSIQLQPQWVPTENGNRLAPGVGLFLKLTNE